jgi:type IV secretory pathway VirB10-like protein
MMSALTVVAFLWGSQPPPSQQTPQQPVQAPTVAAPKTPPAPQPPVSRPPAEQQPAPTPTPTAAPANVPPYPSTPSMDPDRKTALALLDRVEKLVDDALQEKSDDKKSKNGSVGTSGTLEGRSGRLTIDRATLDEILANISQVRMMLQR